MLEIYSHFRFLLGKETSFFSTDGETILTVNVHKDYLRTNYIRQSAIIFALSISTIYQQRNEE